MIETDRVSSQGSAILHEAESGRIVFKSLCGLVLAQVAMGMIMILLSRVYVMVPLDLDDDFGRFDHVLGLRYGSSTAFFVIAVMTLVVGHYCTTHPLKRSKRVLAKLLNFTFQPWFPLIMLVIAVFWYLQLNNSDGDIAAFFARFQGLDVDNVVDAAHYKYILESLPIFEFLAFSLGLLALDPFSLFVGLVMIDVVGGATRARRPEIQGISVSRLHVRACTGVLSAAIMAGIGAIGIYAIGFILGSGLDITWPLYLLKDYGLMLHVYPWVFVGLGVFFASTAILYYFKPRNAKIKILTRIAFIAMVFFPIYGWFYAALLYQALRNPLVNGR
jgi:hypothetical protein